MKNFYLHQEVKYAKECQRLSKLMALCSPLLNFRGSVTGKVQKNQKVNEHKPPEGS